MDTKPPDCLTRLKIAGAAECDPKSVLAYFTRTRKLRIPTLRAIERALAELGLAHLRRAD